jgi:hypothetical protein
MLTFFEDNFLDDVHGRGDWEEKIENAGFLPDVWWSALVAARDQCAPEAPFQQIAKDSSLMVAFSKAVRSVVGDSVTDEMILNATVAMPHLCSMCNIEAWNPCEICGGCVMCCADEYHCTNCGKSAYCGCPNPNPVDSLGNAPDPGEWRVLETRLPQKSA